MGGLVVAVAAPEQVHKLLHVLNLGSPPSSVAFYTLGGYGVGMPGYDMNKDDLLRRLRRIEGQVRGIAQMIEDDRYCIDVLTQISAATKGLQSVAVGMLDDHLRHCVAEAVAAGGPDADRKLTEASAAVERLIKS